MRAIDDLPFRADAISIVPWPQALQAPGGCEHVAVGVAPPDQLHADRQAVAESRRDRSGRVAAEIDRIGQAPADQWIDIDAVDLRRTLGVAVNRIVDRHCGESRRNKKIMRR